MLAGSQAETGEGSGMLPFLLAEKLGWPLVVGLAEVESIENGTAQVLQALPRGQRRRLKVRLPLLATVDNAAPKPRQSAFGPARRGVLAARNVVVVEDSVLGEGALQPARPRPKRLKVIKAKSGADRMKAATAKASGGGGKVLKDVSPQEGAEAILKLLVEEGCCVEALYPKSVGASVDKVFVYCCRPLFIGLTRCWSIFDQLKPRPVRGFFVFMAG